jgi:hypothetical protein
VETRMGLGASKPLRVLDLLLEMKVLVKRLRKYIIDVMQQQRDIDSYALK